MSQESRPDVTGILPGCHRISARIRREGWPDGAGILMTRKSQVIPLAAKGPVVNPVDLKAYDQLLSGGAQI